MKRVQSRTGNAGGQLRLDRKSANVIPLRNTARDFIVVTTQRTGSSWLMDRLNNLPGTEGHMELFYHEPRREPPRAGRNDYPRFIESRQDTAHGVRPFAVFRYLNGLYARHAAAGFKLMYSQLRQYPEILAYVAVRRLPIVHLVRNNHLDVLISEEVAKITGRSHNTVKEARRQKENIRVDLDPTTAVSRIQRLARKQQIMRGVLGRMPNAVMEIGYEELCDEPDCFDLLCRFLNIDSALSNSESRLVKRQRASHTEALGNYEDVRTALERAGLERLLH